MRTHCQYISDPAETRSETRVEPMLDTIDDPILDRILRHSLRDQASNSTDPLRREMAADVAAGRVLLYDAARSSVYAELFAQRAKEVIEWWDGRSDHERQEEYLSARGYLDGLRGSDSDNGGQP